MLTVTVVCGDPGSRATHTLSLHDALPISRVDAHHTITNAEAGQLVARHERPNVVAGLALRSEEHTSELQSRPHLVCRLLLEKKKNQGRPHADSHRGQRRSG